MAAVRPGRDRPGPPSAVGRATARGRNLTWRPAGLFMTDRRPGGQEGEGMGLRSNSRPRRRHKMATDLSPRRESRVKGQGPERRGTGGSQSVVKHPSRGECLFESRSEHSESDRQGKGLTSAASGRRFDRSRLHAGAVSVTGTLSPAPAEPFWRGAARELCVISGAAEEVRE